jgi:hypothetical protein
MQNTIFFWEDYLILNPDIINHDNEKGALSHYEKHGKNEKRQTKLQDISKYSFIYNFENQKNNLKNIIYQTYGLQLNINEKNTNDCSHDFFYLCNKFKIVQAKHKNILYFILNTCNYSKPKNNPIHDNFQMITSLYNEKNIDRAMELLLVLSLNLQNKNIHDIPYIHGCFHWYYYLFFRMLSALTLSRFLHFSHAPPTAILPLSLSSPLSFNNSWSKIKLPFICPCHSRKSSATPSSRRKA